LTTRHERIESPGDHRRGFLRLGVDVTSDHHQSADRLALRAYTVGDVEGRRSAPRGRDVEHVEAEAVSMVDTPENVTGTR
jgi:hypothetical protein